MQMNLIALIVFIFGLFCIEIYQIIRKNELISVTIYNLAIKYPIFPFAIGVLMGHFFWPIK